MCASNALNELAASLPRSLVPLVEQAPDSQKRSVRGRSHGMKYVRLVVQGATNTRREPFPFTLPKLAVSEDKIDVLRRMLVVRVPDIRSEQRQADPNVLSIFEATRADDHRVCMTVSIGSTCLRRGAAPPLP